MKDNPRSFQQIAITHPIPFRNMIPKGM